MHFDFDFAKWWHETIDHLFKHPHADVVAHPAIAAIAAAMPSAPPAAPAVVAPAPAAAPPAPKLDADGKELVTFDPAAHADPAERTVAVQALRVATQTRRGDFLFRIVSPNGLDVSVQGDEIKPAGALNTALSWESFDGHHPYADFQPGVPVIITVKLDAAAYSAADAQPGSFNVQLGETSGTVPCTMSAVVKDEGGNVVPCDPMGGGNGASLHVPYQLGQSYTVAFTAPVATRWGITITPGANP